MKNKRFLIYFVFAFVALCVFPFTVEGYQHRDWGTFNPTGERTQNYSNWGEVECFNGTGGPFTVTYHGTPASGYMKVAIDQFVDREYTDQYAYCNATGRNGSTSINQYRYYFSINPSNSDTNPFEERRVVDIYDGKPIDVKSTITSKNILSVEKISGTEFSSLSLTGCSGTGACTATVTNATEGRTHIYKIRHANVAGIYYETTLEIIERSSTITKFIGDIKYNEYALGESVSSSNMSCSAAVGSEYTVTVQNGSGTQQAKVVSKNNSLTTYNEQKVKCTFTADGVNFTHYYTFNLKAIEPVLVTERFTIYGGDTLNLANELNIKKIVSASNRINAETVSVSGCAVNNTTCGLTARAVLVNDRTHDFVLDYYDDDDVYTRATVQVTEKVVTTEYDLGMINVGGDANKTISATNLTCAADNHHGKYSFLVNPLSSNSYVVLVTSNNDTFVEYTNQSITCTGNNVSYPGRVEYFKLNFGLKKETNPIREIRDFELFVGEELNVAHVLGISSIEDFNYVTGRSAGVFTFDGCGNHDQTCTIRFNGPNSVEHNRPHQIIVTYVNNASRLYEVTMNIVEKDPNMVTKAFAGINGFCEFEDRPEWTFSTWHDSAGKRYTFFESEDRNARLPECKNTSRSGYLIEFKGWKGGFNPGDTLNAETTCTGTLLQPGDKPSFGDAYAPCYELVPHVRLVTNGGAVDTSGVWKFYTEDMSYIAKGSRVTDTVTLPTVKFSGFRVNSTLAAWRNTTTGEIKHVGDSVPLDGSIWTAVVNTVHTQIDLYKTVAWQTTELFSVTGMNGCSGGGPSDYLQASYVNGTCQIYGASITPYDTFVNVTVNLNDGTSRVYKFSVEDRTGINQNGNGEFIVDTSSNIKVGETDDNTLNGFKTNQCKQFFITKGDADTSWTFAHSVKTGGNMNTHNYSVYSTCESDFTTHYLGLCLDPGRRGPNESATGRDYIKVDTDRNGTPDTFKYGNYYNKTDDIQADTDFGSIVSYIVKKFDISKFEQTEGDPKYQRAAAHVAVRTSAIRNGYSAVVDPSDETYASHYYPYEALAKSYADAKASDNNITDAEASAMVDAVVGGHGFKDWDANVKSYLIDIFANYDGSSGAATDSNFERTIDDTKLELIGTHNEGYKITYKGTITAPVGASVDMTACSKPENFGVSCTVNDWSYLKTVDNRKVYNYDVTITALIGADVVPPIGDEEEKKVSFQLTYTDGQDLVNVFIAEQAKGSDNVQRMLVFSTSNPKVFIYFSIVPNDCDLPFLNANNCTSESQCNANIASNDFNPYLFKASGCCKYLLDDSHYIVKRYCDAVCTSSTMTSTCKYVPDGSEKADYYLIKEGAMFDGTEYKNNIGTCVVNVSDDYVNDSAYTVDSQYPFQSYTTKDLDTNFMKYDDANNLINVSAYRNNRYCQVTCKEDWELTMDSFGNFVGKKAVAAGAFFQIVQNDMFIGGTRTCYTTFINYDRFMANLANISDNMVSAYNDYSKWSHVWTDVNNQVKLYQGADGTGKYSSKTTVDYSVDDPVCVEWANSCPNYGQSYAVNGGYYFWEPTQASGNTGGCMQVIDYGNTGTIRETVSCSSTRASETTYNSDNGNSDDHHDSVMTFTNSGKNDYTTRCQFTRTYCPGNDEPFGEEQLSADYKNCEYWDYEKRLTKNKVYTFEAKHQQSKEWLADGNRDSVDAGVETKVKNTTDRPSISLDSDGDCSSYGYYTYKYGNKCYGPCSSGNALGSKCYTTCPTGYPDEYSDYYCSKPSCSGKGDYSTLIGSKCYKSCGGSGHRANPSDGTKCQKWDCASGYTWNSSVSKCVKNTCTSSDYSTFSGTRDNQWGTDYSGSLYCSKEVCPTTTTDIGGTCYTKNQIGCKAGYTQYSSTDEEGSTEYCRKWIDDDDISTHTFDQIVPKYNEKNLVCKIWGKAIDYTVDNTNDFELKIKNSYNGNTEDVKYTNKQFDKTAGTYDGVVETRDSIANLDDNYRQSKPISGNPVVGTYGESYTHQCTVYQGKYQPDVVNPYDSSYGDFGETANVGYSECKPEDDWITHGHDFTKTNDMFCTSHADVSGEDKDNAFCKVVSTNSTTTDVVHVKNDLYVKLSDAFEYISNNMLTEAEDYTDDYRAAMQNASSTIYAHANDMFACQNFQLHNATDDNLADRRNNESLTGKVLGATTKYTNILTKFEPYAAYEYEEKDFMTILGSDNILVQYDEKNDAVYGGTENAFGLATDAKRDVTITLPGGGTEDTQLFRNYLEYYYYNPEQKWDKDSDQAKNYTDTTNNYSYIPSQDGYTASTLADTYKKITWCTVGNIDKGVGYAEGKEGAIVAFDASATTPEWLGGRCYQININYKKAHYVKSSISNSSYYKNKGNWYLRGGDLKEHGDTIDDALRKANARKCTADDSSVVCNNYKTDSEEKKKWSRLGSFNVFPISMGTPRNLYQYTYTFGGIGSFYDGMTGRIMGGEKSIIQDNTRTCFYEVYEEVCMCCGYKKDPGDLVPPYVNKPDSYKYPMSSTDQMGNPNDGTLSIYTNSVSLGNLNLSGNTVADNWSDRQLFMYNGSDMYDDSSQNVLVTDKGANLKDHIESVGEAVYATKPEYAYYLTPDTLKEIRSYNDAVGYELNYNNLKVYSVHNIKCDGTSGINSCKTGDAETINFQHYGSKFLVGEVGQNIHLNDYSYGLINKDTTGICEIKDTQLVANPAYDLAADMETKGCRWIDYIETSNQYRDPTKRSTTSAWFRLSFK